MTARLRRGWVEYDCLGMADCEAVGGRCLCPRRRVIEPEVRQPRGPRNPPAPTLGDLFPEALKRRAG
jgi:hypothetical protein